MLGWPEVLLIVIFIVGPAYGGICRYIADNFEIRRRPRGGSKRDTKKGTKKKPKS